MNRFRVVSNAGLQHIFASGVCVGNELRPLLGARDSLPNRIYHEFLRRDANFLGCSNCFSLEVFR